MDDISGRERIGDIVMCPACAGRPIVSPFAQEDDPPCPMCHGAGMIPSVACKCGRPARLYETNCGREACTKPPEEKKVEFYDDNWWREVIY